MRIELRWVASFSASCFYTARAVAQDRAPDGAELATLVDEPVLALAGEIDSLGLPVEQFWRHLVPLAAQIENNRQLAEVVLAKTLRRTERARAGVEPLARRIADVEGAVLRGRPGLLDELAEQSEPLRRVWDLRGPALLARVAELTDAGLIVANADAVLVCPVFGRGGTANLQYNSVCVEAVQGEASGPLPEVVRLAWLAAQLNADLPMFSERIRPERLPLVAAAAMLPPVLHAASELELAKCDRATVSAALEGGQLEPSATAAKADAILDWWETYLNSRPAWNVALAALGQMLAD